MERKMLLPAQWFGEGRVGSFIEFGEKPKINKLNVERIWEMNIGEVLETIEGDRYINLKTYDLTELAENVNELMKAGWKPVGGMILESTIEEKSYYQTLIKD